MADEKHKPPGVRFPGVVLLAESRHSAQANAVLNRVVERTISFVLCLSTAQIRRLWVQVLSKQRIAVTVVRMARRAVIRKVLHTGPNVFG